MKNKKIVCISDIHGYLPSYVPDGDILVIAGDICPVYESHKASHQAAWINYKFNSWLTSLDDQFDKDHIVMVAGNHDFVFQDGKQLLDDLNCKYLEDSDVTVDGIKIYGYPHCRKLTNWAFYGDDRKLEMVADNIPDDTDILLTHSPPYGILDEILDGPYKSYDEYDKFIGCKNLKKRVNNLPNLKLHVFGHIHTSHGIQKASSLSDHKTISVNASIMDDYYQPIYDIITVDI